jgi:hypothetical protein
MNIHGLLADRAGSLKLSGLQPRVETMLFMTGVQKIVDVHPEDADALAAFGGSSKRSRGVLPVRPRSREEEA